MRSASNSRCKGAGSRVIEVGRAHGEGAEAYAMRQFDKACAARDEKTSIFWGYRLGSRDLYQFGKPPAARYSALIGAPIDRLLSWRHSTTHHIVIVRKRRWVVTLTEQSTPACVGEVAASQPTKLPQFSRGACRGAAFAMRPGLPGRGEIHVQLDRPNCRPLYRP
jgi:hypothetical protein